MSSFILQRCALSLLSLLLLSVAIFVLVRVIPGNAATASLAQIAGGAPLSPAQIEQRVRDLGLDRPYLSQYLSWVSRLARGDAGTSTTTGLRATHGLLSRLGVTLELAAIALAYTVVFGVAGGILAARGDGRWTGALVRIGAYVGLSVPVMWAGLLLVLGLASLTGVFVAGGFHSPTEDPGLHARVMLLAAGVLALRPSALMLRLVHISMQDALLQDHVRSARAKGLGEAAVHWRHAFRGAAGPAVAFAGAEAVFMLGGSVVVEQVFGLPGMGRSLAASVLERDFPSVQATVLLFGLLAVAASFAADLVSAWLDPRNRMDSATTEQSP